VCNKKEIAQHAPKAFARLHEANLPTPDKVMTIVNKFDLVTEHCDMVAAFAYNKPHSSQLPGDFVSGYQAAHRALKVEHFGPYHHIANGWATLVNYLRFKKLKTNKKCKEYEVYKNDPQSTPVSEIQTSIYAPVK
jgi:predicted transcriptional regulator YdeE